MEIFPKYQQNKKTASFVFSYTIFPFQNPIDIDIKSRVL
jgi:hypothetical protein